MCKAAAFLASMAVLAVAGWTAAAETSPPPGSTLALQGSLVCNGACLPAPKPGDHLMVLYAIDGTPEIRAEVETIMAQFYPDKGLDAEAAEKVMGEFTARLKYYISPESPALLNGKPKPENHYCQPAAPSAVVGEVIVKDGKKWLVAKSIDPVVLHYPKRMLVSNKPFVMPDREPLVLRVTDKLTLKCVAIPPGKYLMGTPFYMWPYYVEEYPHPVTLTKPFYMAEIPVTQEMYEAIMSDNPSTVRDPQLPVQDPRFADIEKFCEALSRKTGRRVRLPTDAEWEYAARVGTSNPGFPQKFTDQNSSGPEGFKAPLRVKSKLPNAWGLFDMASCWWEVTADKGMYNVRHGEVDPRYPPERPDLSKVQRSGRGIVKDNWSIGTHEFITEKGYAGQKFRVVVEAD
jgi:Sulfatase-modifying factor enzyme 1